MQQTGIQHSLASVLIVDDDLLIRKMLCGSIRPLGHTIFEAENSNKALNVLATEAVDIVITDVNMPGMNGVDLLKQIHGTNSKIPVIMITGAAALDSAIESLNAGAFAYIVKPIETEQVISVINRAAQIVDEMHMQRDVFDHYQELQRHFEEPQNAEQNTENEMVKDLISSLLHELGNATAALKMNLYDMQSQQISPHTVKKQLGDLENSANSIASILERLRQYPQRGLQLEHIDLRLVIESTIEIAKQKFPDIKITATMPAESVCLWCASYEISRAFMSILENSAEILGQRRKKSGKVHVEVTMAETQVVVTFTDNGPGFQNVLTDKLFSPGYTTKVRRGFVHNLGLGLFIVRATTQLHGGDVWLHNASSGGAVVEIHLPRTHNVENVRRAG